VTARVSYVALSSSSSRGLRSCRRLRTHSALPSSLLSVALGPRCHPAMVSRYLLERFDLTTYDAEVSRHDPEDFVVRFSRRVDLERVLGTLAPNAPFSLMWRPWRRTSLASGGSFRFRVLVRMRRVPLHARSTEVAQTILGSACARIELALPEVTPADDI